jgi:nucleotide-binding universal stress UspA family protein
MGASNIYSADEQLEQISFYWITLNSGEAKPLTVRLLGKNRDVQFDLGGGNRIPRAGEAQARSVRELRAAGVGVGNVLLVPDERPENIDLFQSVLTMLDAEVRLGVAVPFQVNGQSPYSQIQDQSQRLGRAVQVHRLDGQPGPRIVQVASEEHYDLIVIGLSGEPPSGHQLPLPTWVEFVLRNAPCRVFLASNPGVPVDVEEK